MIAAMFVFSLGPIQAQEKRQYLNIGADPVNTNRVVNWETECLVKIADDYFGKFGTGSGNDVEGWLRKGTPVIVDRATGRAISILLCDNPVRGDWFPGGARDCGPQPKPATPVEPRTDKLDVTEKITVEHTGTVHIIHEGEVTVKTQQPKQKKGRAPSAKTLPATDISEKSVRLNCAVNPFGEATTYRFEYGTKASSFDTTTARQSAGDGDVDREAFANLVTELKKNTTYYFRCVASNQFGEVYGTTLNFTTKRGGMSGGAVAAILGGIGAAGAVVAVVLTHKDSGSAGGPKSPPPN